MLITVLAARAECRLALAQGLQGRLAAQGFALHTLAALRLSPSGAWATDNTWAAQQQALSHAMQSRLLVLSDGGFALLAAEMGPSAPQALAAAAQAQLARSTLVLLCATGLRDGVTAQALDARLRTQLLAAKVPFSVLHGDADAALAQAWQALCMAASGVLLHATLPEAVSASRPWLGNCDACSDSACEHRLFSDLLAHRDEA